MTVWAFTAAIDAASGTVASGNLVAADLLDHQPWEANGLALHAEA